MIFNMMIRKYDIAILPDIFNQLNDKRYGSELSESICGYSCPTEMTYYYNRDYLCLTPATAEDPGRSSEGYKKLSVGPEGFFCAICPKKGRFNKTINEVMDYLIARLQEEYPETFFSTDYKYFLFVDGHNLPLAYFDNLGLFAMDYLYDMTGEMICGDSEKFCRFCLTCLLEFLEVDESDN